MPPILAGTLEFYATLEKAGTLARAAAGGDTLADLARNPAVTFDPVAYGDYRERIRFEAARTALDVLSDPTGIPPHLYSGRDSLMAYRYYAALSDTGGSASGAEETRRQDDTFLARWAQHKADRLLAVELARRTTYDDEWQACIALAAGVRDDAAAGRDWTANWRELRAKAVSLLDVDVHLAATDRELGRRLNRAADLVRALNRPRSLGVHAVTVRLTPGALSGPEPVVVELRVAGEAQVLRSDPVNLGEAAPAGTGWVGAGDLDRRLTIRPQDGMVARVLDADGRELLAVDYGSLSGGPGPGALGRPRGPALGTLTFRIDPSWWRNPELPALQ